MSTSDDTDGEDMYLDMNLADVVFPELLQVKKTTKNKTKNIGIMNKWFLSFITSLSAPCLFLFV